ncbi:MAG: carbamoyltransferase [Anaerolineales bacterium]
MFVLGISCFYHDAAAALIHDGLLVAAAEEERFTRRKHDYGFPHHAIDFCLRQAGISAEDLDYAVFYEKPLLKFERILLTTLGMFPRSWGVFRESMIAWFNEKLWVKGQIMSKLNLPAEKVLFVEHHLSHAASSFFCSPFKEAAIITVDGVGEWSTAIMGTGTADWDGTGQNLIDVLHDVRFPHSLGLLYSAFTAYLGFRVNSGEYKVMGMAPYGEARYQDKVYELIKVASDGSFQLNMDYFSFHHSTRNAFNGRFTKLFGPPRVHETEFFTPKTHPERNGPKALENQYYADIAASIQRVTEDVLLKMARHAYERTGLKRLCMAGGVALNSVANGRILRETPFEEIFIQPAAGDSGGALGAALYVYHVLLGQPRRFVMEHAYWGADYGEDAIRSALEARGLHYTRVEDDEGITDMAVEALLQRKVVGWFQGRFEWGPRALGNRSILADPRRPEMKDIVNRRIKFREPFRPFAPVILEERAEEYFDLHEAARHYPARYMLLVTEVAADKRESIPAVTHVNGSGRLQTIRRESNPRYYRIVEKFGEATGVPVLLNTSFNLRGEPIVTSPENAIDTFLNSGLDMLVAGECVAYREQ